MASSFPWVGHVQPRQSAKAWAARALSAWPNGGPVVVTGIGIGHLFVALWNFNREIHELSVEAGPLAAAALLGSVSLLCCLVGYWLWNSDYGPRERWVVAGGTVFGALLTWAIIYVSVLVRLSEGRTVSEPLLVLSLASGQGAFSGALVAILYARARRAAAAARRRRDQIEFVSSVLRHDVLNSMTVIRSRAELIGEGETDRDAEFAETIVNRSEKVIDLSERVKDVVAVMASDDALELEPVDLRPVVTAQVDAITPTAADATIETAVDDVAVVADDLLAEVIGNLLENALSHGAADGTTVTVTTTTADDRVQLRVADTGPGVPDADRERIFERGVSSSDGGFGLFFARTMVDHYGGEIWVEDRQDGQTGAVFVVELQKARDGPFEIRSG